MGGYLTIPINNVAANTQSRYTTHFSSTQSAYSRILHRIFSLAVLDGAMEGWSWEDVGVRMLGGFRDDIVISSGRAIVGLVM